MFFLLRSACCIALVAFMLPATQEPVSWPDLGRSIETVAADQLQSLCAPAGVPCGDARLARAVLAAGLGAGRSVPSRPSTDTLAASDLIPAWSGPATRS